MNESDDHDNSMQNQFDEVCVLIDELNMLNLSDGITDKAMELFYEIKSYFTSDDFAGLPDINPEIQFLSEKETTRYYAIYIFDEEQKRRFYETISSLSWFEFSEKLFALYEGNPNLILPFLENMFCPCIYDSDLDSCSIYFTFLDFHAYSTEKTRAALEICSLLNIDCDASFRIFRTKENAIYTVLKNKKINKKQTEDLFTIVKKRFCFSYDYNKNYLEHLFQILPMKVRNELFGKGIPNAL